MRRVPTVRRRFDTRRVLGCLMLCALVTASSPASAVDAPPGAAALRDARAAWDKGAFETAEPLYRDAIEKGGLAPADVLEGYVRLGTIRASLGKKDLALASFRAASVLDATFPVPKETGIQGRALAAQAKKDTAKIGSIRLKVNAPAETPSGKSFTVTAELDAAHVPMVTSFALLARDGTSGREVIAEAKAGETAELGVAWYVALPEASVVVRVDALDKRGNRLATAEQRVRVLPGPPKAVAAGAASKPAAPPQSRKGGFWSSPWPYVVGGLALAGAGTAVYFGVRPSDQVSVGQVGVRSN